MTKVIVYGGVDFINSDRNSFWFSPIFVIVMTIFIDITGFGMIIPLLPFFADSLHAGSTALGVLVASFAVMQFFFSPVLGRISDKIGRRPVLLLSILTSLVSFVLFSVANSYLVLLLSRLIAGMATETAVAQAYIADITSSGERATGLGRIAAAHGAGFIIGPAIGGFLSIYGFWAAGLGAAVLTLVNLLFAFFLLPESVNPENSNRLSKVRKPDGNYLRVFLETVTRPVIGSVLVILFLITFAFSTIPVTTPLLGRDYFGIGPAEMSYFFIYIGVVQVLLQGFVVGRLVGMFGEEKMTAAATLLMAFGMLMTPLIQHILNYLFSLTFVVLAIGILNTVIPSLISKKTAAEEQGGVLGTAQSASSIARVPGPLLGGFVYEFAGVSSPFFLSGTLLIAAFGMSCRVLRACTR